MSLNHLLVLYHLTVLVCTKTTTNLSIRGLLMDIYLAVLQLSKYPTLATSTSVNSYLVATNKKKTLHLKR